MPAGHPRQDLGKDNPQAVAGVFAEFDTSLTAIDRGAAPIWLVAQALRDPGNLGTMLRTGDAVGAGGLILVDDCADPFSVEAVRASMGAIFTQTDRAGAVGRVPALAARRRRPAGRRVLRDAQPYRGAPYAAPCFLLVGNESRRIAAGIRGRLRPARHHADARAGGQPERRGGRRSARLRSACRARKITAADSPIQRPLRHASPRRRECATHSPYAPRPPGMRPSPFFFPLFSPSLPFFLFFSSFSLGAGVPAAGE